MPDALTEEQRQEAEAILGVSSDELAARMLPLIQPVFEELERYKAAVEVARKYGEHYPTCNAPPPEIRKLKPSSPEWRAWREANRGKCDCWKSAMEGKLQPVNDTDRKTEAELWKAFAAACWECGSTAPRTDQFLCSTCQNAALNRGVTMSPEVIAEVCHEANRALTRHTKDVPDQPAWADAPEEMKTSSVHGVKWRLANLDAPASAQHDEWMRQKLADGWTLGEKKDPEKKTHPALIPYADLKPEVKAKDALFTAIVKALA